MIPAYTTIKQFRMNKENEAELYTDPFYTAQGGYKMTLCVYPRLKKVTHISAYIHLMKKPFLSVVSLPSSSLIANKSVLFDEDKPLECR